MRGMLCLEDVPPPAEAEENAGVVDAHSMINQAMQNPVGLELPRDQARIERMAHVLAQYGQDRILGLAESAQQNGTSIIEEALQEDLFNEMMADTATGVPLPPSNDNDPL